MVYFMNMFYSNGNFFKKYSYDMLNQKNKKKKTLKLLCYKSFNIAV